MNESHQQPAPSSAPQTVAPNQFELQARDVSVTFSTTSITGEPLFHYKDRTQEVNRRGDEIQQVDTGIGKLVTITLKLTVDTGPLLFSVLIPRTRPIAQGQEQEIVTEGIHTRSRLALLPSPDQLQTYMVVRLHGTARFVLS